MGVSTQCVNVLSRRPLGTQRTSSLPARSSKFQRPVSKNQTPNTRHMFSRHKTVFSRHKISKIRSQFSRHQSGMVKTTTAVPTCPETRCKHPPGCQYDHIWYLVKQLQCTAKTLFVKNILYFRDIFRKAKKKKRE